MPFNERKNLKKTASGIGFYIFTCTLTMYLVAILMGVVMAFGNKKDINSLTSLLQITASITALFVVGLFYCHISNTSLNDVIPLKKETDTRVIILCIIAAFAVAFVSNYITDIFLKSISLIGIEDNTNVSYESNGVIDNILYIISVAVVPPIAEEFAFRGIILQKMRKYGDTFAILISALFFGLLHGNFIQIPFAFIIGLAVAFITIKTGTIIPAIITHFLVNFSSIIVSIINDNNLADSALTEGIYSAFVFIVLAAGIIAAYKLSKIKGFFKLEDSSTLMTFKQRTGAVFSSAGIIFALITISIETVLSTIPYGS